MIACDTAGCKGRANARGLCKACYCRASRQGTLPPRRPRPSLAERFAAKVRVTDAGCWEWTGARNSCGYGHIKRPGRRGAGAHRVSYELHHGPIPDGMCVLHSCDNPACVNPNHLSLGTHAENMRQAAERDRCRFGTRNPSAVIDDATARAIRERYAKGDVSQGALADEYGVGRNLIWKVVNGETWRRAA